MVLDFEYGINTGNRFIDLVGHDEDPEEFIARQTQPEEKPKKSTKDSKTVSSATTKKTTNKPASATPANVSSTSTTKTNKENVAGKSTTNDQRRPQSNVLSDNNNQQTRIDSGRGGGGGGRGFSRRGTGSAGQDRPPYEGRGRGGGYPRFHQHEGHQTFNETRGFEQSGETQEGGDNNQRFGGYQGRGRGRGRGEGGGGDFGRGRGRGGQRGVFYNRNYDGGRGRGRGRGGRGGSFYNRNTDESSQQQEQPQQSQQPEQLEQPQQQQQQQPYQQRQQRTSENNQWQQNTDSSFDNARSQPAKTGDQELDTEQSLQDRSFEPDGARRGRGHFRGRTFRSNRNYGQDRQYPQDREGGEGGQEEYRHNRRQHDRQPRSYVTGVKSIEKKDGEGAHNWGNAAEIPDEQTITDELNETADQAASAPKNWADQVDEAEKKQITLEEYKKQLEEKKRAHQEKLPQFNRRAAGEGEDPKNWQFKHEYRKKNDDGESEEEEQQSGAEEDEDEEDDGEQTSGKKKVITIPLQFKPIEFPRGGSFGSRGGPRRGSGRFQDRPYRDDQQRPKSPNQQQSPMSQQTGEYQYDDQQQRQYRGGSRQGPGRNEYRRSYGNSARGSRGGYNRSRADPNTPDFANALDFPTLPKQ